MLTNGPTTESLHRTAAATTAQKVVIVNGSAEILELLETVLDAGHYDVVFVESSQHARVRRARPRAGVRRLRLDGTTVSGRRRDRSQGSRWQA